MTEEGPQPANLIRRRREQLNELIPGEYTQAAVARRLNVTPDTLRAWETVPKLGHRPKRVWKPRKRMARRLARVLGTTVEALGLGEATVADQDHAADALPESPPRPD